MAKIINDKYYTSPELAEYIVNKTKEIIGEDNITEYIEPSAGAGVFLNYFDKPYLAYDIKPEDNRIMEQNFLNLDLKYKKGRCVIGNPPYGDRNVLSVQFYKKSINLSDYIAFILPISQFQNNQQMYEFDMVYSEDLGKRIYSDIEVHCCLNIYKRPILGLNNKNNYKLKDVNVFEYRRCGSYKKPIDYDIGICSWGASIGKEIEYVGQYAQENYIKVFNEKYKNTIIKLIKNTNWEQIFNMTTTPKIQTWRINKYIKEQIPEIN